MNTVSFVNTKILITCSQLDQIKDQVVVSIYFFPFKVDFHSQETQMHTACIYTEALTLFQTMLC